MGASRRSKQAGKEDEDDDFIVSSKYETEMSKYDGDEETNFCEFVPLLICLTLFAAIVIYVIFDFEEAIKVFDQIIEYIRAHPYQAIAIIIAAYTFLIIFIMPIMQLHILIAFAYCKVFNSFWIGFLFATGVIFLGLMVGALCAILLGRYLIANWLKKQIRKSRSDMAKKFKIIDSMFLTSGIMFVALIRLMWLPFGIMSYLLSVTCVSILDYMIGNTATLVDLSLTVLLGCSLWQTTENSQNEDGGTNTLSIIILCIEIIVTITVTVIIAIIAKREFDKRYEIAEKQQKERKLRRKQKREAGADAEDDEIEQEEDPLMMEDQ